MRVTGHPAPLTVVNGRSSRYETLTEPLLLTERMSINIAPHSLRVEYRRRCPALFAPHGDENGNGKPSRQHDTGAVSHEDLPYKVEVWDASGLAVDRVVAVTASRSIGFGAYYAAAQEYPARYITLRYKGSLIASWNPPGYP